MGLFSRAIWVLVLVLIVGGIRNLLQDSQANVPSKEDEIFEQFPHRTTYKLKNYTHNGKPYIAKLPLHMHHGDFSTVGFYANYDKLVEQIKLDEGPYSGSADFVPLTLETPQGKKGAYFIWTAHYSEIDLNPYEELIFCMAIAHKNSKKSSLKCHDEELCLADAFNKKEQYCHLLYLSSDLPIAYGIEILGTNKKKSDGATIVYAPVNGTKEVNITCTFKDVFNANLNVDMNPLAGVKLVPRLVNQMGLNNTLSQLWDVLNARRQETSIRLSRGLTTIFDSSKYFPEMRVVARFPEAVIEPWNPSKHRVDVHLKEINKFELTPAVVITARKARGVFLPPTAGEGAV